MSWQRLVERRWLLTTVLVIVAAGVCARLGIWQLDRLKQRRAFNAHILAVQAMAPLQLPAASSVEELSGMEYRQVRATGSYDFGRQVVLRNQYYNGEPGYHLVTPLVMQDGEAILVDRGWIPADGNSAQPGWHKYDVPGQVTVSGVIRASQTATIAFGPSDPTPSPGQSGLDQWIYLNVGRIAQQLPYRVLPVYVQQSPDPGRSGPPVPQQVELDLSEGPHLGYAIQWFAFAGILLVGYPFYVRRQEAIKHT